MNASPATNCWLAKCLCARSADFPLVIHVGLCQGPELALVGRFYKSAGLRVRCTAKEQVYGLRLSNRAGGLSALRGAVRFVPLKQGWLLRNLCIAESFRRQGLARHLLVAALDQLQPDDCYCYAWDYLQSLYTGAGFQQRQPETVDASIAADYRRYQQQRKHLQLLHFHKDPPGVDF